MKSINLKRNTCTALIIALLPVCINAQGLHISSGLQLVTNGPVVLVLNDASLVNDGAFAAGSSTVIFTGNAARTTYIGGSRPVSFNNLTIDKFSNDVQLNNHISITGNLGMQRGNLLLNNYSVDLGRSGSILGEKNSARIMGAGLVKAIALLNNPKAVNPGNIGVEITSPVAMGLTEITRGHIQQRNIEGEASIYRYFDINPQMNRDLHATLRFFYLDAELAGQNENGLSLFTSAHEHSQWLLAGKDNNDITKNWIAKTKIDRLERYTVAIPSPKTFSGMRKTYAKVYPNPARNQFNLTFFSDEEKDATIQLYDQLGYLLEQRKVHCLPGINNINWNITRYAAASYELVFENLDQQHIKVMKQ